MLSGRMLFAAANSRRVGGAPYGVDLITGAETYSTDASGTASSAADEDQSTAWASGDFTGDKYWRVDFGVGVKKYVTKWQLDEVRTDATTVTAIAIQGSNDASAWTTLDTNSGPFSSNSLVTTEFDNTTGYRYYQLVFSRSVLGQITIENIRMHESESGSGPFELGTWNHGSGTNTNIGSTNGSPGIRWLCDFTGTLTQVEIAKGTGGASEDISAYLYSDDGGSPASPSSLLATSSDTANMLANEAKQWTFNQAVTAGTYYWIVLENPATAAGINTVPITTKFGSGRNSTITSIDATGQVPKTSSRDWRVGIRVTN